MTKKYPLSPSRMPGNDGRWFLKAAGVDGRATELGDVDADSESTSELVRELWGSGSDQDELATWSPRQLSRLVVRRRDVRWPMVAGGVLLVALVVGAALWLPGTSARRASAVANRYEMAYVTLYEDLAPGQQVLATLTEPASTVADFADASAVITQMHDGADDALALVTDPLPTAYPLAPATPLSQLGPQRDSLSVQATAAEAIAGRLGDLLDYRIATARLFATGDLPTDRTGVGLNQLTERLAVAAADSAIALEQLPEDVAFAEHNEAAREAVTRLSTWQADYLEALRVGDTAAAEVLVAEWDSTSDQLDALFVAALARARTEIDADIIELAAGIDSSLDRLEAL